jgi:hypothetical protein
MRLINRLLYGLFGLLGVGLGASAFLGVLGADAVGEEAHLWRELGAAGVFLGLMNFWCLWNYERRLQVHLPLMVFAALFAVIHWQDWLGDLLQRAGKDGFQVLATADRRIELQQSLTRSLPAVVVLVAPSNTLEDLLPLVPGLLAAISKSAPGQLLHVAN